MNFHNWILLPLTWCWIENVSFHTSYVLPLFPVSYLSDNCFVDLWVLCIITKLFSKKCFAETQRSSKWWDLSLNSHLSKSLYFTTWTFNVLALILFRILDLLFPKLTVSDIDLDCVERGSWKLCTSTLSWFFSFKFNVWCNVKVLNINGVSLMDFFFPIPCFELRSIKCRWLPLVNELVVYSLCYQIQPAMYLYFLRC